MTMFIMSHDKPCHGCQKPWDVSRLETHEAEGNQVRYCPDCVPKYKEFVRICGFEEERLNRLLDRFIEDTRKHVELKEIPQDHPKRVHFPFPPGNAGGLRLE